MGAQAPTRLGYPLVLLLAAVLGADLVRMLRTAARRIGALLGRWLPNSAARALASLLVLVVALTLFQGEFVDGFFAVTDKMFSSVNGETEPGVQPPTDPLRSRLRNIGAEIRASDDLGFGAAGAV
jgi:uncharacterized membrane protein